MNFYNVFQNFGVNETTNCIKVIAYESNNCPDLSIGFIGVWDDLTCHAGRRNGAVVQLRSWRVACTGV